MRKAEEYERHARECDALARKAVSPEERAQLQAMADTWRGLAAHREVIRISSGASANETDTADE
jgi:hypothetical protein